MAAEARVPAATAAPPRARRTPLALGDGWRAALVVGLLVALWSLLFRGFDGGRWSDVPIFKSFIDPELYTRDPFISTLHNGTPAAYTYRVIAAFAGALPFLPLDGALFLLYLPTSVLSLALLYRIALHLVGDRRSAVLFLLLYVAGFRLLTVGSAILHSAELTPAFLALPFQLGALYAFLRERHALAGILAGLGVVVHAPTTSYVGLAIGLAYLIRVRHYGLRNVAVTGVLMVLCAAPAVVGALLQHTDALPDWALRLARIELATDLSVAINWDRAALRTYNLVGLLLLAVAFVLTASGARSAGGRVNAGSRAPAHLTGGFEATPIPPVILSEAKDLPTQTGRSVRSFASLRMTQGDGLGMTRGDETTSTRTATGETAPSLRGSLAAAVATDERRAVLALCGAVLILCAVAFVFIDVTLRGPVSTLVARLQFPRAAWIVNLLGLAYVAHYVTLAWTSGRLPRLPLLALVAAMLVSPSDFVPIDPVWPIAALLVVLSELASRLLPPARRVAAVRALDGLAVLAVLALAGASLALRRTSLLDFEDGGRSAAMAGMLLLAWLAARLLARPAGPRAALGAGLALALVGAFAVRGSTDWLYQARHRGGLASAAQFQAWAREHTPKDAVFLILPSEPNNESFYKHADRALYLIRERANQAVYFREHNDEFQARVLALGVSGVLRYREELDPAYRRLTEERVRELAARFGVTHFVPARAGDFTFPIAYQEGGWTVYEVEGGE